MSTPFHSMRRWILILLLVVYPFQVALAMADACYASTASGVTHHAAEGAQASPQIAAAKVAMLQAAVLQAADDGAGPADPHCPACMFGHILTLPSASVAVGVERLADAASAPPAAFPASRPAPRPERPQWTAAAQ
ncbi:hypothetical protein HH212_21825 [Massilia forsythiae]|uniref:DUF2946 domain-containing protein n=1 Tax=Massilia forsythiae TaxID=2728020 RepID=A0A7Z2ZUI7_9BURK|nr:hypothetical protein [Massilia forsythiae]QJE02335.1 hypothetical protein HH212_21825 [Massilia forsythiae]